MDISIIGAGPIGCYAASLLAKKGIDVEIFEEHKKIGEPISCTGILSKDVKKILELKKDFLVNKLKRVEVIGKDKKAEFKIEDYVVDRCKFDNYLAEKAKENGAKINLGVKVIDVNNGRLVFNKERFNKSAKNKNVNKIIGADGPNSIVAKKINPNRTVRYYIGKQAVVKGNFDKETYKVFLNASPNFFGWVVPEDENTARIGIAALSNPSVYFDKFLAGIKEVRKINNYQGGLIPVYNPRYKLQKNNMYIIGDAALQVKASTGGGIVPGLKAAKILCKCICKNQNYEKKIFPIKKELLMHLFIRKTLNKFKEKDYDELIDMLKNQKKLFMKHSRDSSMKLMLNLILREPRLLKFGRYLV